MARVTVEDCILKIPNRFELVMTASQRAREIAAGAELMVEKDNDKNPVISLREIADTDISLEGLKESLIKNHQKVIEIEEDEEDIIDLMEGESEWAGVEVSAAETEAHRDGMHEEIIANLEPDAPVVDQGEGLIGQAIEAPITDDSEEKF